MAQFKVEKMFVDPTKEEVLIINNASRGRDVFVLHNTFEELGFKIKVHEDVTCERLLKLVEKNVNNCNTAGLIFVLGEGDDGRVKCADGVVERKDLLCAGAMNNAKPRIFVFDGNFQQSEEMSVEEARKHNVLPVYSATKGTAASYDDKNHSIFISSLCKYMRGQFSFAETLRMTAKDIVQMQTSTTTNDELFENLFLNNIASAEKSIETLAGGGEELCTLKTIE